MHMQTTTAPVVKQADSCSRCSQGSPVVTLDEAIYEVQYALLEATPAMQLLPPDWKPSNHRCGPPSIMNGFPADSIHAFARQYNGSEHSQQRGRWLAIMENGGLIQMDLDRGEMPLDPTAFPPDAELFPNRVAVQLEVLKRNFEIFRMARVPKVWNIGLIRRVPVAETAQDHSGSTIGSQSDPLDVRNSTGKAKAYRVGLTHPQFGVVAISEQSFPIEDCDSILAKSSACLVGTGVRS